jgi:hypothetical protein
MKKILTKEQEAKKTRRNQLIIGMILVGLMLLSTAGYAINNGSDTTVASKIDYNGVTFVRNSDYWNFNFKGQDFTTQYNPQEVKNINVFSQIYLKDYSNKPLYFVTESGQPEMEIALNLKNNVLRIQNACLTEKNCENNLPVKNCSLDNVIIIREAINTTESVYQDRQCVFITAEYSNLTRYEDAFLFKMLEI